MIDYESQLNSPWESYERRQARQLLKHIPPEKRQEFIESVQARIKLGGEVPNRNVLNTLLEEIRKENKNEGPNTKCDSSAPNGD